VERASLARPMDPGPAIGLSPAPGRTFLWTSRKIRGRLRVVKSASQARHAPPRRPFAYIWNATAACSD
jgi:hypothetical protein